MSIYISFQRQGGDSSAPIPTRLFAICIYIKRFIYTKYIPSPLRYAGNGKGGEESSTSRVKGRGREGTGEK